AGASGGADLRVHLSKLLFRDKRPVVDEADPVALAAAWAFTQIDSPKITEQLFALLESDSPSVQALAILSLGERKASNLAERLIPLLDDGVPPTTRAAAAFAAGEINAQRARTALQHMALDRKSTRLNSS